MTTSNGNSSRRAAAVSAALLLLVLLPGCASDGGTAGAPLSQDVTAQPDVTVEETPTSSDPEEATAPTVEQSSGPASEPPAVEEEVVITIVDFAYQLPEALPPGATVTVVNEDTAAHTVTSSPAGAFGVTVQGGQSATFTAPDAPGEYRLICLFHGNMADSLVVGRP